MVLVGVDSLFPLYCEFSYDGISLDAEVEVTGGVVSYHVFYVLGIGGGFGVSSNFSGEVYWSVISFFLYPRVSFWSELEVSFSLGVFFFSFEL